MADWRLLDGRNPVESPDDFPAQTISCDVELRRELDRLRKLQPAIVSLQSPKDEALQIGIGGPVAAIRWFRDPKNSELCRDVLANCPYGSDRVDFLSEGDTIAFWPEHLMPIDHAVDIIVSFFKHERLPEWVSWKEWDPARNKWIIKSSPKVRSA
jgi:hypothetical protein